MIWQKKAELLFHVESHIELLGTMHFIRRKKIFTNRYH